MKKILLVLLALCCFPLALPAQDFAKAEALFDKGDFAAALPVYQEIAQNASGELRYKAQLRAAACEYMNGAYTTAAQSMMDYPLPQDDLWKARFLLYRAQMLGNIPQMYRRNAEPQREIDTPDARQSVEQWTADQRKAQIRQDYQTLWGLRAQLLNAPTAAETFILNTKDTDLQRIPTLFDFTVQKILENLSAQDSYPQPKNTAFLDGYAQASAKETAFLARAGLLKEAARLGGKNRAAARLFWQTDYVLLPFTYPDAVTFSDKPKAADAAAKLLENLSGLSAKNGAADAPDYARAYALSRLAEVLYAQDDYARALRAAQFCESKFSKKFSFTQDCARTAANILRTEISLKAAAVLNPQAPQVRVTARNSEKVFFRLYPVTLDELKTLFKKEAPYLNNDNLAYLSNIVPATAKNLLERKKPIEAFSQPWSYEKPYHDAQQTVTLPALKNGFYVLIAASRDNFDAELSALILNITDLALFSVSALQDNPDAYVTTLTSSDTKKSAPLLHFYTLNLQTGEPVAGARITLLKQHESDDEHYTSGPNGQAAVNKSFTWGPRQHFYLYSAPLLAQKDDSTAYTHTSFFNLSPDEPVRVFLQTDRAIYRPEQKVQFSVNAFEVLPRGLRVLAGQSVSLQVRDANYKEIFKTELALNEMGTAQTEMTLPSADTLLGNFSVHATVKTDRRNYQASHSFKVEEYKRPDYEVTLNAPEKPLALGQKAVVTGRAQYYTGAPMAKAQVKYRLTQKPYLPPFYWWCYFAQPQADKIIAESETVTDDAGNFSVSFTPELIHAKDEFVRYTLQADVLDDSGRPITATRDYKISTQEKLVKLTFAQGFYDAGKPTPAFAQADLTDTEGNSATGTLTVRAARLENKFTVPENASYRKPTLEAYYKDAREEQVLFNRKITFARAGAKDLDLPAAPAGVYRLTLQADKGSAQQLIFIVADENKPLTLPVTTLPQHKTYHAGETARVLIGADQAQGDKHILLFQKQNFLVAKDILPQGKSVYSFPVKAAYRGGVSLGWLAAGNYQAAQGSAALEVPFDNKELKVAWHAPDTVKPGAKFAWKITAARPAGQAADGQASLTVYDKSLDYYAAKKNPFTLASLYACANGAPDISSNRADTDGMSFSFDKQTHAAYVPELPLPTLNLSMPRRFYAMRGAVKTMALANAKMAADSLDTMAMEETANFAAPQAMALGVAQASADAEEAQEAPSGSAEEPRTNFAETAYFNSVLPVKNGQAAGVFTMPQSLTAWNVLGFVLTREAELGAFTASAVTRKDFMVRLVLPRFYREGDSGVIQAAVTNLSGKSVSVPVSLEIKDETGTKDQLARFGVTQKRQTVQVAPNQTVFAAWKVTAPDGPALYRITAVARSGQESDAEQKTFPVLSGRTRLLATQNLALKNGTNTLTLAELSADKTAQPEVAALTIHPSLALSVLNDMPNLLTDSSSDLISVLSRFAPLAVVHQFYTTYPELKAAVKKLPKRTTLTAPWNDKDPLRLTLLEQTPWLLRSQGKALRESELTSLFDDNAVSAQLQKELLRIRKLQSASGAFTWFAGGPDDDYLTLYALDTFAQTLAYNAQIPQDAAKKAYRYIVPRIEKRLREDKTASAGSVSFALYAAYVLSAFPQNWEQVSEAKTYIKKWADYADAQARFMTPLGQTYAAAVYHRLGDDIKANRYLDLVLSRMKEDTLTGAYFAPEAQSWVWYRDTLTTQTVTLRTLLEIRPASPKVDALTQWLLFNRHANQWRNSRSATQAVFTLLDVMKAKGALSQPSAYRINWAGEQTALRFEPLDWTADLQLVKQGAQLTPAAYRAQITKQSPMTDFASLSAVYSSADAKPSPEGVMNLTREYFVRFMDANGTPKLRPLSDGARVQAGDEIEVHLTVSTGSAFEYVRINDPKPAGFESQTLLSRWTYNPVSMYEEVRDAQTNFFVNWLPAGKVTLSYVLRPTTAGTFRALPAQMQSMYAPEFGAHTGTGAFEVLAK